MKKYCENCGDEFTATRKDKKYCSDDCKSEAFHARQEEKPAAELSFADIQTPMPDKAHPEQRQSKADLDKMIALKQLELQLEQQRHQQRLAEKESKHRRNMEKKQLQQVEEKVAQQVQKQRKKLHEEVVDLLEEVLNQEGEEITERELKGFRRRTIKLKKEIEEFCQRISFKDDIEENDHYLCLDNLKELFDELIEDLENDEDCDHYEEFEIGFSLKYDMEQCMDSEFDF